MAESSSTRTQTSLTAPPSSGKHSTRLARTIVRGIATGVCVGLVATLLVLVIAGIIFNAIGVRERLIEILIPALMLICGVSVGTIAGVGAHRLRLECQRRTAGQCINCGYDIRATPDRCPECGRVPRGRH